MHERLETVYYNVRSNCCLFVCLLAVYTSREVVLQWTDRTYMPQMAPLQQFDVKKVNLNAYDAIWGPSKFIIIVSIIYFVSLFSTA